MSQKITTIGFDADDTLWQNEHFFKLTEAQFVELLAEHAEPKHLTERLLEAERRNVKHYGFGIKGFTLSMIETAIEVTSGDIPAPVIGKILDAGREMLSHPVEILPHAGEALEALSKTHTLILITKGDLFDQERKLAQSGLDQYFDGVEIVSNKTTQTYQRIFAQHGSGADEAMMVGNSLKSDVVPALDAGSWGVYVPHEITWGLEHADSPDHAERFHTIPHLGQLVDLINKLG